MDDLQIDWLLVVLGFSMLVLIIVGALERWQKSDDPIKLSLPKWRAPSLNKALAYRLDRAGLVSITPAMFITLALVAGVFLSIAMMILFHAIGAALFGPPIAAFAAWMYLLGQERKRTMRFSQEIVPFMWKMYSTVAARGSHRLALEQALMGGTGGEIRDPRDTDTPLMCAALRPLLRRLLAQEDLNTALPDSLDLVPTSGWERLVRRLLIYEARGGDIKPLFKQAIEDENRNLKKDAMLYTAYVKVTRDQKLMLIMSVTALPAAHFLMGGLLTPLVTSLIGWIILFIAASFMMGGIFYARRTVRSIEEDIDF